MSNLEPIRKKPKGTTKQYREYEAILRKQEARQRRAERRQRRRQELTPALRASVWKRFGRTCYICHKGGADTIDHVVPLDKGGANELNNLRPAHEECNKKKGNKIWALPEELESVGW